MNQTNVIIVSAPSGSGKSTLVGLLLKKVPEIIFSISHTTREARGGEKNGEAYHFVTPEEFRRMLEAQEFLEWAVLFGTHYYGTSRRSLDQARATGQDLLLDIDVQGAAQVKKNLPEAISVFIMPPSRQELEHRLRYRRLDQDSVIERRLKQAATEIQGYTRYDYAIVNENLEHASACLNAIVLEARWRTRNNDGPPSPEVRKWMELADSCRTSVAAQRVEPILRSFGVEAVQADK